MKIRTGFVSNSSSSSFVLFGMELSDSEMDTMYMKKLEKSMLEKYGSADKVPDNIKGPYGVSDETIFLTVQAEGVEALDELIDGNYEKAEYIEDVAYVDEYTGYVIGFHPSWFRSNPDKTFNDAVKEYTEKMIELGIAPEKIEFSYFEEVTYN